MVSAKVEAADAAFLYLPLKSATGGSGLTGVEVIAVDLTDAEGRTGVGFSYALKGGGRLAVAAARELAAEHVLGKPADAPMATWRAMDAALNRLGRGLHYLAMAAIDVALWDLHAKQRDITLAAALGGRARRLPVYGSGGFTPTQSPEEAAENAVALIDRGFPLVKPRLNGNRADIARVQAVRDAIPYEADVCVDVTEKTDLNRALWLADALAEIGCLWFEEPLAAHDYAGYAALARTARVPLATGEHHQGTREVMPLFQAGAVSVIQPDLAMMGGITECLRVAWQAEHFGVSVGPHFLPALFVHVASAAPNVTWLEDFPLLEPMFDIDVDVDDKQRMAPGSRPGHGLLWADGARAEFAAKEG